MLINMEEVVLMKVSINFTYL